MWIKQCRGLTYLAQACLRCLYTADTLSIIQTCNQCLFPILPLVVSLLYRRSCQSTQEVSPLPSCSRPISSPFSFLFSFFPPLLVCIVISRSVVNQRWCRARRKWHVSDRKPPRDQTGQLFNFALLPVQHCSDTQTCTKTGSRFFSLWWPEAQIHILVNTYLNYLFGFLSFFKASLLQAGLVNHACIPHTDTHIIISWLGVGMTA